MKSLVASSGNANRVEVDSAGTIGNHTGHHADRRMQVAARKRGYSLESIARQVTPRDIDSFQLIVAMDRDNYRDLQRLCQGVQPHVRLLSEFLDEGWPTDVPDPYYGGDDGFEYVLDMLEAAAPKILESLTVGKAI
jgi:protein-tyrosine phosphatase